MSTGEHTHFIIIIIVIRIYQRQRSHTDHDTPITYCAHNSRDMMHSHRQVVIYRTAGIMLMLAGLYYECPVDANANTTAIDAMLRCRVCSVFMYMMMMMIC